MERRIRLGELLIRAGLITELQLNAALAEQRKWGGRLGRILVDMNFISEDILVKGLCRLLGARRAELAKLEVPDAVLARFDPTDCMQRGYLPVRFNPADKRVTLAMVDVQNIALLDELRFKYGFTYEPVLAGERALAKASRELFYGAGYTQDPTREEASFKLVNNQGATLIKDRQNVADAAREQSATTAVERPGRRPEPPQTQNDGRKLADFESAQRRQARAIKTVLEILIEKGVFTRDEYLACVNRQSD